MFSSSLKALVLLAATQGALGATYSISNTVIGEDFNSFFSYEAIADPTNGRVNYVNQATAIADGLTSYTSDSFILRADDTTVLSASGPGRNSVRLMSNTAYTTHAAVFNIKHMPTGCGTWPAVWEANPANWPGAGEFDIVEGVNVNTQDQTTLHTSPGCTMPGGIAMSGTPLETDCNTAVNGNDGCGVLNNDSDNYGAPFNSNGGGWYAVERTDDFIKAWFWPATSTSVPSDVSGGASSVDTSNWGEPYAYFPNTDCDLATMFSGNYIIINLTFCGDWAGQSSVWADSGCPSTCIDYVNENPSAFSEAYFDFASIRIYE